MGGTEVANSKVDKKNNSTSQTVGSLDAESIRQMDLRSLDALVLPNGTIRQWSKDNISSHENYSASTSGRGFGAHRDKAPEFIKHEGLREFVGQMNYLKSEYDSAQMKTLQEIHKDKITFTNVMGIKLTNNPEADFEKASKKFNAFMNELESKSGKNSKEKIEAKVEELKIQIERHEKNIESKQELISKASEGSSAYRRISKEIDKKVATISNLSEKLNEESAKLEKLESKNDYVNKDVNGLKISQGNFLRTWEEKQNIHREYLPNASNDPNAQLLANTRPTEYYGNFASKIEKDSHYRELNVEAEERARAKKQSEFEAAQKAHMDMARSAFQRSMKSHPGSSFESRQAAQRQFASMPKETREAAMNEYYAKNPLPPQSTYRVSDSIARGYSARDLAAAKEFAPEEYAAVKTSREKQGIKDSDDQRKQERREAISSSPDKSSQAVSISTLPKANTLADDYKVRIFSVKDLSEAEKQQQFNSIKKEILNLSETEREQLIKDLKSNSTLATQVEKNVNSWLEKEAETIHAKAKALYVYREIKALNEIDGGDAGILNRKRNLEKYLSSLSIDEREKINNFVSIAINEVKGSNPNKIDNNGLAALEKMKDLIA